MFERILFSQTYLTLLKAIACGCWQNTVFESVTAECTSMVRNVWVGHAVAEYVHVNEDKKVQLKFLVQHANSDPPQDLLNAGKSGKPCTVEFLTKLLPDRYSFCAGIIDEKKY